MRVYLIVNVARCGSTYFCALLRKANNLGRPRQYFTNCSESIKALEAWHRISRGCGENGVTGNKGNHKDTTTLLRWIKPELVIHLVRQDVLGQAISYKRAVQTKQWILPLGAKPNKAVVYNRSAITDMIRTINHHNRLIRTELKPHMRLTYEDLVTAPGDQVRRVAKRMGIELEEPLDTEVLARIQRDEVTEQWRERYQAGE